MQLTNFEVNDTLSSAELHRLLRDVHVLSNVLITGETPNQFLTLSVEPSNLVITSVDDIPDEEGLWASYDSLPDTTVVSHIGKVQLYTSRYKAEVSTSSNQKPIECLVN